MADSVPPEASRPTVRWRTGFVLYWIVWMTVVILVACSDDSTSARPPDDCAASPGDTSVVCGGNNFKIY